MLISEIRKVIYFSTLRVSSGKCHSENRKRGKTLLKKKKHKIGTLTTKWEKIGENRKQAKRRRNYFEDWHVAWRRHNYAECNIMKCRKETKKNIRASLPLFFRKAMAHMLRSSRFASAFITGGLKNKAEQLIGVHEDYGGNHF